eukprot:Gb_03370 [translate_table: standard]
MEEMEKEESSKNEVVSEENAHEYKYEFPVWMPLRRKFDPDGPFFAAGNAERELLAKQVTLDLTEDEKTQITCMQYEEFWDLPCPIIGCGARLSGIADFEDHYFARHTAICSVCSRVFPTTTLLNIHISESHDSFFQAKVARGYPMYECLVEGCGLKFNADRARHQHLVDKHKFPLSFEFHKRQHPSKRQRQRLRSRQGNRSKQPEMHGKPRNYSGRSTKPFPDQVLNKSNAKPNAEKENMEVEQNIDVLTSAVSKLSTEDNAPSVVSFGRRHNRAFAFVPRSMHGKTRQSSLPEDKVSH